MSFPDVTPEQITSIVKFLSKKLATLPTPDLGIICGSGLGGLAATLEAPVMIIKYEDIPGFPRSTVHGHAGELHVGSLGGKTVICMKGRFHYYEGYAPSVVCLPVRVMAALGIKLLFVTNAAGGANPAYNVGDVMIMKDHVSFLGLAGIHPLRGFNDARFGPRFPALNDAYAKEHIALLKTCAADTKFAPGLHEGCYYGFSGPTYESPYEIELVRACKGDAVGMSTVFEVAAAAHAGVKCAGLSLITNQCIGAFDDDSNPPHHAEVLEAVKGTEAHLQRLVTDFISKVDLSKTDRPKAYAHFQEEAKNASFLCSLLPANPFKCTRKKSSSCCPFMTTLQLLTAAGVAAAGAGILIKALKKN